MASAGSDAEQIRSLDNEDLGGWLGLSCLLA